MQSNIQNTSKVKLETVDLFSGLGGISYALKDFVKTTLYCDIQPYCQNLLFERMKNCDIDKAPVHSDIKTLYLSGLQPTMLCAGFPCTDISSIGLQKGINSETQSGLFLEIVRLLDESPSIKILFLENVSNIIKCGMREIVNALTERGFTFCWKMKSAGSYGAPHQRTRWFCLAIKKECDPEIRLQLYNSIDAKSSSFIRWSNNEPQKRVTCKPGLCKDDDYDQNWSLRCQALGNSVVPYVVTNAFVELVKLHKNIPNIIECFGDYGIEMGNITSFPDSGLIHELRCYSLPDTNETKRNENDTMFRYSLTHNDKDITLHRLPTPRRGITHASTLTDRSIRDLATILVYCKETSEYLQSNGINLGDNKPHSVLAPNVNYIEWMMGYPKDWTKISTPMYPKKTQNTHYEENDGEMPEVKTQKSEKNKSYKPRYNGMHMFMREHPGKSVKQIAELWKDVSQEKKEEYTKQAKSLTIQMRS